MGRRSRNSGSAQEAGKSNFIHAPAADLDDDDSSATWQESESHDKAGDQPLSRSDIERQLRARRRLEQYQEERRLRRLIEDDWGDWRDE
ncbi:MAG: hypothetical protein AMJ69_02095 [Gammaproteobacteria bacterium SG8_47]|nr:MAG: hypothetical protein AMJ69_02095 [Gammaproteobacteria bacterium SG8_47]